MCRELLDLPLQMRQLKKCEWQNLVFGLSRGEEDELTPSSQHFGDGGQVDDEAVCQAERVTPKRVEAIAPCLPACSQHLNRVAEV